MLGNLCLHDAAIDTHRGARDPAVEPNATNVGRLVLLPFDRQTHSCGGVKFDAILLVEIDTQA